VSIDRESIMEALFALLKACPPFLTVERRVRPWSSVVEQPALFLSNSKEEWPDPAARGLPRKVVITVELLIYCKTPLSEVPSRQLNCLVRAIEEVLAPAGAMANWQTLGGLVQHCWIGGELQHFPGDLAEQAFAQIPVKILVTA
jgi:hypothetical protein